MSGFHIAYRLTKTPVILKDGGTGTWRDAKKLVRQWYLEEAANLRSVTQKSYFDKPVHPPIPQNEIIAYTEDGNQVNL